MLAAFRMGARHSGLSQLSFFQSRTQTIMQPDLLSSILSAISKRVNQHSFNTWFKPVSRAAIEDRTLFLSVPNQMFRDWISSNYFDIIEESLEELDLGGYKVTLLIEEGASMAANASSMPDGRPIQTA